MTSTAMEELLYDEINDYYQYLEDVFNLTNKSLGYRNDEFEYGYCIFSLYLVEKFGMDVIKKSWELMVNDRAMSALNSAIEDKASSLKTVYEEFSNWLYFTGSRAKPGEYFDEASDYPELKPIEKF